MQKSMTSRERVLAALDHQETDRIPFSMTFGVNTPAKEDLRQYFQMDSLEAVEDYLNRFNDIRWVSPRYVGPDDRNRTVDNETTVDVWGVERKAISYGEGEYAEIYHHPLAEVQTERELKDYEWPSSVWWDVTQIKKMVEGINEKDEYAIAVGNGNIFETTWYMRGFDKTLTDLIRKPDLVWTIMEKVTDYYIAYFEKILEEVGELIDIVFTADDLGGQEGLLMSLDLWEKMIKPHHKKLNKVIHECGQGEGRRDGVKIMYHSDGSIMEAIPGLIDINIDILQALQFELQGMDAKKIKEKYGDQLCFNGGVSVQQTLPYGTTEDVKEEVKGLIEILGNNGGYILGPSHAIQAGTPPENIVALLETMEDYYPF